MFQWAIDCCPENYSSIREWNENKSLAWIINLPLTFIIVIIQGFVFDLLRERKLNK